MSPVILPDEHPEAEITILDRTQPIARKDYPCAWAKDGHIIPQGARYVRAVYKLKGKFESDHICVDCWCGREAEGNGN